MLDKYKFNSMFYIIIDSAELYSTKANLRKQVITKNL